MKTGIDINVVKELLKGTPFNKCNAEYITQGVSTDVFKLIDKDTHYLKILPEEESLPAIILTNKLLLELGVSIPKIEYSSKDNIIIDNRSFYIETEIKGKSLKEDNTMTDQQRDKILFEAGKDLAKINSITVQGVGWIEGTKENSLYSQGKTYDDFILNSMNERLEELSKENVLSDNQIEKIKKYISENKDIINIQNTSYLAHGDFSTDHIYHIDGIYSGIIDFGDIRGTSKYHDLAHFYTFNNDYFNVLNDGYHSVYKLPPNHMESTKIEAVIFGVSKLWWISKNRREKLDNHPTLKLFEEVIY